MYPGRGGAQVAVGPVGWLNWFCSSIGSSCHVWRLLLLMKLMRVRMQRVHKDCCWSGSAVLLQWTVQLQPGWMYLGRGSATLKLAVQ